MSPAEALSAARALRDVADWIKAYTHASIAAGSAPWDHEQSPDQLLSELARRLHPGAAGRFYLQDARGYVGNCVIWWCPRGAGYTTDLSQAGTFNAEEARTGRDTDVAWPQEYIDSLSRPTVDMQALKRDRRARL